MENKVSVRTLVERVMVSGDIVAAGAVQRMLEGSRGHRRLQGEYGARARSEVPISLDVQGHGLCLRVHGRIDVLWQEGDTPVCVEEIKTTRRDPDKIDAQEYPLHWAQAECYAHMLCAAHGLPFLEVRLTYLQADSDARSRMSRTVSAQTLEQRFTALTDAYLRMCSEQLAWQGLRDASMQALPFPFTQYRAGQREMAGHAYVAVRDGGQLLAEAPTGIGKTAAMLFSACKAMGQGHTSRIFYLTARGPTQQAAQEAMDMLCARGLRARWVTLAAKEKMCACPGAACLPEECPRAKGHYDRLAAAMEEALAHDGHSAQYNRAVSDRHGICPFEFSLDLSLHCDVVIGDYNYAFDPRAKLRRFFMEKSDAALLVDEAHNLPERAREMFSARLSSPGLRVLRREVGRMSRRLLLYRTLGKAIAALERQEADGALATALYAFTGAAEELFSQKLPFHAALLDRYFEARAFLDSLEARDEYPQDFTVLTPPKGLHVFCTNPAPLLAECFSMCRSAVLFSATLHPLPYFARICGCSPEVARIRLPSPFPPDNLRVMVCPLPTRYTMREESAQAVAQSIAAMVQGRAQGNYLVFFSSYAYLCAIRPLVEELLPQARIVEQRTGMDEEERRRFLALFEPGEGVLLAFAVMGGLFGEGIDLPGERLCGVAVVGVGLPQVGEEREALRKRFDREDDGFACAYVYPGMAKVTQAAGRVIRTMQDRGVVLLIDERFTQERYRRLLPTHWRPLIARDAGAVRALVRDFWQG